MGYLVETSGRVLLPLDREDAAYEALRTVMGEHRGWFHPDDEQWPVTSLTELASYAATEVTRDGDWLVLTTDEEGDPKWSDQADAFYAELARWVSDGTVVITGEDGSRWRYTYSPDGVVEESLDDDPPPAPPAKRGWFRRWAR